MSKTRNKNARQIIMRGLRALRPELRHTAVWGGAGYALGGFILSDFRHTAIGLTIAALGLADQYADYRVRRSQASSVPSGGNLPSSDRSPG